MRSLLMRLIKFFVRAAYAICRALFRQRPNRVLFLSRQGNSMQLDFELIVKRLEAEHPGVECIAICCRSDKDLRSTFRYAVAFMRSIYLFATSSACVLNSYWPAVCLLEGMPGPKVIQIWHAAGKIKQSGWQTVGRGMGHSRQAADLLAMHRNYDVVIAGARAWNPFYCASFGISEEKIANIGLPRLDYLLEHKANAQERFFTKYPELKGKRLVFYAPTFRQGMDEGAAHLVQMLAEDPRNGVLFRRHPNQKPIAIDSGRVYRAPSFSSLDLLLVSDYLITDYSAIAVEGATAGLKTLYYCFDIDAYIQDNGLNLDPRDSMSSATFRTAEEIVRALDAPYPEQEFSAYCDRWVLPREDLGHSTERIVDMICDELSS